MKFLIIILIIYHISACQEQLSSTQEENQQFSLQDTLQQIENKTMTFAKLYSLDTVLILGSGLDEISGLDYLPEKECLLAHNDEKGTIYELDNISGETLSKYKFSGAGDYEGIAHDNKNIYIVKHNGTIYKYNLNHKKTQVLKTSLSASNDVEGLCVDKINHTLLLACKGQPLNKNKKKKNEKCIYAYDLSKNKLIKEPRYQINDNTLIQWVKENYKHTSLSDQKKKIKRVKDFSPSGLSFTNNQDALYILSARGSTLAILNQDGALASIHFLDEKIIPQPEGIAFDNSNNLYIGTEGKGYSGKIFKYLYHVQ